MLVGIGIAAALVVAGGVGYWLYSRQKDASNQSALNVGLASSSRAIRIAGSTFNGTVVARTQHFTDIQTAAGNYTRVFSPYLNYYSDGAWNDLDLTVVTNPPQPTDWPSSWPWPFKYAALGSALQVALGDNSDATNTALLGVRSSARHECGFVLKPLNVTSNGNPTVDSTNYSLTWSNLWTQTDLKYQLGPGKITKTLLLKAAGHPASFRFVYRLFPGMTAALVNGGAQVSDAQGNVVLNLRAPWAVDSAGTPVRATLTPGGTVTYNGITCPTLIITPNATDLASAVYPVTLDPTTTLSGASQIEDALLYLYNGTFNYGANPEFDVGTFSVAGVREQASVMRILSPSTNIPAGTLTAARLKLWRKSSASSTKTATLNIHAVAAGDDWVCGTANGANQAGSCDWQHRKYPTFWLGEPTRGCQASGTDYDATPLGSISLNAYTAGADVQISIDLTTTFFANIRDGSRANQGIVTVVDPSVVGNYFSFRSTDNGSNLPSFEFDYTLGCPLAVLNMVR